MKLNHLEYLDAEEAFTAVKVYIEMHITEQYNKLTKSICH